MSASRADAAAARLCADWLAFGRQLDRASLAFALLALAALLCAPLAAVPGAVLMLAVFAGAVEKVLALRVAFDQRVFAGWAAAWETQADTATTTTLAAFDAALARAGLRDANAATLRPLDQRINGALRLYRQQCAAFALQVLLTLAAAASSLSVTRP